MQLRLFEEDSEFERYYYDRAIRCLRRYDNEWRSGDALKYRSVSTTPDYESSGVLPDCSAIALCNHRGVVLGLFEIMHRRNTASVFSLQSWRAIRVREEQVSVGEKITNKIPDNVIVGVF